MKKPSDDPEIISITPEEASRRTGIPEHTIRQAMADRSLPYLEVNHKVKVIRIVVLRAWLIDLEGMTSGGIVAHMPTATTRRLNPKLLGRMAIAGRRKPLRDKKGR